MSRVYIIPLASVDHPEHVTALRLQKADKAYFILESWISAASSSYDLLKYQLEGWYGLEVKTVFVNNNHLLSYVEKFREIFNAEQGHNIYVNLSTGNKITAIAGMIACMLWKGIPYSVRPGPKNAKRSHVDGTFLRYYPIYGVDFLPVFETAKPSADSMKVLSLINEAGGDISKKSLIEQLQSPAYRMIPQYQPWATKSAPHSRLHAILDPLEKKWKFITIRAKGRWSKVSLTEEGKEALRIFGVGKDYR